MSKIFEIIFYGRGGQGVKSASQIVANSIIKDGYYIQAFPEYGPERAGAPVKAFVRISEKPITIHGPVENADLAVVVDPTLLTSINVVEMLDSKGILLANFHETAEKVRQLTKFKGKIYSVDATKITRDILGKNMPNIAMLGGVAKLYPRLNLKSLKNEVKHKFLEKLGPDKVQLNIKALDKVYSEVSN